MKTTARRARSSFAAAEREGMRRMRVEERGVKHPEVEVQLTGTDGNVFAIIGKVRDALRRAGHADAAKEFETAALSSESYDAVLQLCMRTVEVA